jgi:hypothetical protein
MIQGSDKEWKGAMDGLAAGLVTPVVGAFTGFLTSVVSNIFEQRREVGKSVREARLLVYASLWHKFGFMPRWPRGSLTPPQLRELSASLRDWFFGTPPETALHARRRRPRHHPRRHVPVG